MTLCYRKKSYLCLRLINFDLSDRMKKVLIAAFLLAFYAVTAHAQVARLYTTQHGLKTNACHSVDLDSRGFVWVSGSSTLGIFDGKSFHYLPTTNEEGRELFQTAYEVEEADHDKYWVCTSHGLFLLDARNTKFQHVFLRENEDSIYGSATNAIIDYPKPNHKLVTTDGFNTFVLNTKTLKVDQQLSGQLNNIIQDGFVTTPMIDQQERLWVATKSTPLICIDLKTMKRHPFGYTPAAAAIIGSSTVKALLETKDGMLIGTNHGLLMYDRGQNTVHELPLPTSNLCISSIICTHDNRILVGTDGRGIWEYNDSEATPTLHPLYDQAAGFDISYGKVMDMKEDSKGNVIAAFLQKGLVVIPPQNDCFHYHPISPLANGKNVTCVTSMAIDQQENYWVATDGCGVFTTNGMRLSTAHPVGEGLQSSLVQDIKVDKHGTVWVGSFGGGVQYLENGRWTNTGLDMLSHEMVMTMCYDAASDQLLVGTNGSGVFTIDIATRSVQKTEVPFGYNPWVSALLRDSQQTLWIATSSGLYHYNPKSGSRGELRMGNVRICNAFAIQQDGDNILVATDEGLLIYHTKTKQQQLIGKEQGLSCPSICSITTTDHYIWLATRTNIASVDKRTHTVANYSSFSGYEIGEFHRNSFVKPGHGYILFGGDNGIICFTPQLITNRPTKLNPLYFTNFVTPLHTEEMDANIFYAKDIYLRHDNATFSIEFASVELGDPERIQYEYILEGHETMWHSDGNALLARYSSLAPGTYTLRVRAYLEDTPTEYAENTIRIHISAPWYATTGAFVFYAIIVLFILYLIYQQIKARKQQKEQLRLSAEQDRIKEAKLKMFTSITHELRSPLTMIESPLKQLMAEDTDAGHQSLYATMRRNCDRLLDIVKQITDIRKIDSGQLKLHLEEHDYVEYSNQVFEQFKGIATVKEITFEIEHHEETLPMMMDTTHFEKIITNLLSNAFKFTPAGGKVTAQSSIVDNQVELRFYNSGSHFSDEDIAHLWERFYQGSAGNDATGSGIGLNLVHELVKLHNGTISAKNTQPDGVEFTLRFPYFRLATPETTDAQGIHRTKPLVMLVDDDTELIHYMTQQLEKDYTILCAFSGNAAWKSVQTQRPDVVVTDYRMPDGNGMELCQRIKSTPDTDSTPVILLTGEGNETLQLQSLNIQADYYLEKPVNIIMLRSAISQVLQVREKMRNKTRRSALNDEMPVPVMENADDKLFGRISEAIKKHLDDSEFSVQQLADEVGISRVHLNRKMKERYGISPNVFIKSFRLKQAARLLISNRANVSEVAYTVGFSSHSYFTTAFHDYFGFSPKDFIAHYSQEENQEALQKLLE